MPLPIITSLSFFIASPQPTFRKSGNKKGVASPGEKERKPRTTDAFVHLCCKPSRPHWNVFVPTDGEDNAKVMPDRPDRLARLASRGLARAGRRPVELAGRSCFAPPRCSKSMARTKWGTASHDFATPIGLQKKTGDATFAASGA
jgi:hypothetical protein